MPSYSLCCLSAINLTKFVKNPFTDEAYFDNEAFKETIKIGVRFLDNVLDATEYPLKKIEDFSKQWRRIGLGFTGLGDTFIRMGIKYGSLESKELSHFIGASLRDYSYISSSLLAKEKGTFPEYNKKILDANFISGLPLNVQDYVHKYGLRNIGINTIAPTGTTSLSLGNNCSSGIEPVFSLEYNRTYRIDNEGETNTETVYDEAWLDYQALEENFGKEVKYPDYFVTTLDVSGEDSMEIQSIFQKYIDHSISKTHNLAPGTTFEEYKDYFLLAWKKGLKGFTSFNTMGNMKGILEHKDETLSKNEKRITPERPSSLPCEIHNITTKGEHFLVLIGLLDGKPYELFATRDIDKKVSGKWKTGSIDKKKKNHYDLVIDGEVVISDLSKNFSHEVYRVLNRMLSMSIRHGVPLQFIVDQLNKNTDFTAYDKVISRVLKKYIKEGEEVLSKEVCPECGSDLIYAGGCKSCSNMCGWGKCD